MESIRPRPPVEQEIGRALQVLVFGIALGASSVQAHGLNYLLVKAVPAEGSLRLEISADYTDNPLIESSAQAQEIISSLLEISSTNGTGTVGTATGFKFQTTSEIDPTCPLKLPTDPTAPPHRLLTGTTTELLDATQITLSVPKGNPHDVIIWTTPTDSLPGQKFLLIAGETTQPILIPPSKRWSWLGAGAAVAAALGLVGWWIWRKLQSPPVLARPE